MKSKPVTLGIYSILAVVFLIFCIGTFQLITNRQQLVFCNVGQGDSAYIRLQDNFDVLIDGGPDTRILGCLKRHMPLYDSTLDLVILSHADADHFKGLLAVTQFYDIDQFVVPSGSNDSSDYLRLLSQLEENQTSIISAFKGDSISVPNGHIFFFWPPADPGFSCTSERNNCSYVFTFDIDGFTTMFTGDIDLTRTPVDISFPDISVEVLKVPHHGSKNGLSGSFFDEVQPTVSVISSGKSNSYGHPHEEVVSLLYPSVIKRTDTQGDVIFKF